MADKDDDANPFEEGPWVDRDDDGPPMPGGVLRDAPAMSSDDDAGGTAPPERKADWRDRVVDEPDLEEAAPLVDLDDDREPPWEPSPGPAPAREKPTDRDSPLEGGFVDRDNPEDDELNAAAERELSALGDDRYPLDDDDDDEEVEARRDAADDRSDTDVRDRGLRAAGAVDRDGGIPEPLVDSDEDGLAAPWASRGAAPAPAADSGRRLPLTLMAVAALAVILLAVGGYGVLSERAALRDRIEELQARLATAGAEPGPAEPGPAEPDPAEPDPAEPDPAATAALARLGDLENELAALAQENSALRARIADLRGRLDSTGIDAGNGNDGPARGAGRAEDSPDAAAPAGVATTAAASSGATSAGSSGAGGTWFVNFSSYTEPATARRRAAELSVDAGRVVVQDAVSGGRMVYRVRVVGIESRTAADAVASRLAAAYSLPRLWVGRE